jgi:hypothetical protein
LIKTDTLGDSLWTKTFGGTDRDMGFSVQMTLPDNGYIIAGMTQSFGSGRSDVYLIKTDSLGDTLWTRTFGGIDADQGFSVYQTSDGGYIITGFTDYTIGFNTDVYLIKTDQNGQVERDGGVVSIDLPEDTVLTDSTYSVEATVKNYGGALLTFDVIASIDGYTDTVQIIDSPSQSSTKVTFEDWIVPFSDSITYIMEICTHVSQDSDSTNDCVLKSIFAHEGLGPYLLSAVASDNVNPLPGIDNDDYVLLTFHEPTNKPNLDAVNINTVLALSQGHSWLDGFGAIGSATWNGLGDQLLVYLSTALGLPTISVGDTIFPDGTTIMDKWGNPAVYPKEISGSFDPQPGLEETPPFGLPKVFSLSQNYPSPFHHTTLIRYILPNIEKNIPVRLAVYDITGRLLETLVNEVQEPGVYQLPISSNQLPASGIYFYRLKAGDFTSTRKMIYLK